MSVSIVSAVIAAVGTLLSGALLSAILLHRRESPKAKAEAAKVTAESAKVKAEASEILASTAIDLVQGITSRVTVLEAREGAYRNHISLLNSHIEKRLPPPPPDLPEILKQIA